MNEVYCMNLETGERFTKEFYDLREQRKFLIKCKYSTKIMVLGYTYQSEFQREYLLVR